MQTLNDAINGVFLRRVADVRAAGTSEGVSKAWDTRGRGKKETGVDLKESSKVGHYTVGRHAGGDDEGRPYRVHDAVGLVSTHKNRDEATYAARARLRIDKNYDRHKSTDYKSNSDKASVRGHLLDAQKHVENGDIERANRRTDMAEGIMDRVAGKK